MSDTFKNVSENERIELSWNPFCFIFITLYCTTLPAVSILKVAKDQMMHLQLEKTAVFEPNPALQRNPSAPSSSTVNGGCYRRSFPPIGRYSLLHRTTTWPTTRLDVWGCRTVPASILRRATLLGFVAAFASRSTFRLSRAEVKRARRGAEITIRVKCWKAAPDLTKPRGK